MAGGRACQQERFSGCSKIVSSPPGVRIYGDRLLSRGEDISCLMRAMSLIMASNFVQLCSLFAYSFGLLLSLRAPCARNKFSKDTVWCEARITHLKSRHPEAGFSITTPQ